MKVFLFTPLLLVAICISCVITFKSNNLRKDSEGFNGAKENFLSNNSNLFNEHQNLTLHERHGLLKNISILKKKSRRLKKRQIFPEKIKQNNYGMILDSNASHFQPTTFLIPQNSFNKAQANVGSFDKLHSYKPPFNNNYGNHHQSSHKPYPNSFNRRFQYYRVVPVYLAFPYNYSEYMLGPVKLHTSNSPQTYMPRKSSNYKTLVSSINKNFKQDSDKHISELSNKMNQNLDTKQEHREKKSPSNCSVTIFNLPHLISLIDNILKNNYSKVEHKGSFSQNKTTTKSYVSNNKKLSQFNLLQVKNNLKTSPESDFDVPSYETNISQPFKNISVLHEKTTIKNKDFRNSKMEAKNNEINATEMEESVVPSTDTSNISRDDQTNIERSLPQKKNYFLPPHNENGIDFLDKDKGCDIGKQSHKKKSSINANGYFVPILKSFKEFRNGLSERMTIKNPYKKFNNNLKDKIKMKNEETIHEFKTAKNNFKIYPGSVSDVPLYDKNKIVQSSEKNTVPKTENQIENKTALKKKLLDDLLNDARRDDYREYESHGNSPKLFLSFSNENQKKEKLRKKKKSRNSNLRIKNDRSKLEIFKTEFKKREKLQRKLNKRKRVLSKTIPMNTSKYLSTKKISVTLKPTTPSDFDGLCSSLSASCCKGKNNSCVVRSGMNTCFCDENCLHLRDCCSDFTKVCAGKLFFEFIF